MAPLSAVEEDAVPKRGARRNTEAQFEGLLAQIYDAALSPPAWNKVVGSIVQALGGDVGALLVREERQTGADIELIALSGYPPTALGAYERHFAALDVRMAPLVALPSSTAYVDDRTMAFVEIEKSEIHNEFYHPMGLAHGMGLNLFSEGDRFGFISTHRAPTKGGFRPDEVALLERLSPHLVRALQLQRQVLRANALSSGFRLALDHFQTAAFLVEPMGRFIAANLAGEAILRDPASPLHVHANRLTARRPADAVALDRAIKHAGSGFGREAAIPAAPLRLKQGQDKPSLSIMAAPLRPADPIGFATAPTVLLFATSAQAGMIIDPAVLRPLFDLSPSEAEIAASLCSGSALEAIASQRGVSRETVRFQLKRILMKTETNSQAQLVALLMQSLAVLRR